MKPIGIIALLAGGYIAWRWYFNADQSGAGGFSPVSAVDDFIETNLGYRVMSEQWYKDLTGGGAPYADAISKAESKNGIPTYMLARLLWQESRFRKDIIDGTTKSKAGAVGIAQIVPRWHPAVDPLDAFASINYAAKFLASLKKQFGTWELALKAYNWGGGNVRKWQAGEITEPLETKNYSRQILADLSDLTGVSYA